jgi:hypothetical protein
VTPGVSLQVAVEGNGTPAIDIRHRNCVGRSTSFGLVFGRFGGKGI